MVSLPSLDWYSAKLTIDRVRSTDVNVVAATDASELTISSFVSDVIRE